jgi:hypothetical protein
MGSASLRVVKETTCTVMCGRFQSNHVLSPAAPRPMGRGASVRVRVFEFDITSPRTLRHILFSSLGLLLGIGGLAVRDRGVS